MYDCEIIKTHSISTDWNRVGFVLEANILTSYYYILKKNLPVIKTDVCFYERENKKNEFV